MRVEFFGGTARLSRGLDAQEFDLAPGLLDGFLGGGAEAMSLHREGLLKLALAEHLDRAGLVLADDALGHEVLGADGGAGAEELELLEVQHGVLDAEDVVETAAGQAAEERHLAALEAGLAREAAAAL